MVYSKPPPFTATPPSPACCFPAFSTPSASTSPPRPVSMQFSGPDLTVSKFKVDVIVVTENVFTEFTLQRAATQLLIEWPFLSFRTNLPHTAVSNKATKKAAHGFLSMRHDDRQIPPDLAGTKTEHGITVYDADILGDLFDKNATSWSNRLCPRIFTIQAVTMQDATVFKFTMQHAAGDAVGLYKAAAAFCEGLGGDVHRRSVNLDRRYTLAGRGTVATKQQRVRSLLRTQQARNWFDVCTSSKLFAVKTLARKWEAARNNTTRWQTIHFSGEIIETWQEIARKAGVKVSRFNLLASWIHLNLAAFARSLDPTISERFAFTASVREFLKRSQAPDAEVWNPITIAVVSPLPRLESPRAVKLLAGAINIRDHVSSVRTPQYMQDYATLMEKIPERLCQMQDMGKRVPVSMLLTSWSHAPFPELEMWSDPGQQRKPAMVQPIIGGISSIPLPDRGVLDRQIGVVWEGKDGDGYWLTANLEDDLWRKIMDVSM